MTTTARMIAVLPDPDNPLVVDVFGNTVRVARVDDPFWFDERANTIYGIFPTILDRDVSERGQWLVSHEITCYGREKTFAEWLGVIRAGLDMIFVEDNGLGQRLIWFFDARDETPVPVDEWTDEERTAFEEDGISPDPRGGNFGYVLNLDEPGFSEWGYAPYPRRSQTKEEHRQEFLDRLQALSDAFGGNIAVIDPTRPDANLTVDDLVKEYES